MIVIANSPGENACSPPPTEIGFLIGGNETLPSDQSVSDPSFCPCSGPKVSIPTLPVPLWGHFAESTGTGLIVGGGVSEGEDHNYQDPKAVFIWRYNSSTWEPLPNLHRPRVNSRVQFAENKIIVTGGTSTDAQLPCDMSTEELDTRHSEKGWTLIEHMADETMIIDPSQCLSLFTSYDPVTVRIPCGKI